LDQAHILSLYTHFEDRKYIYMVMEYANCSSLEEELKKEVRIKEG
jgi:serine/threonine protein kinase